MQGLSAAENPRYLLLDYPVYTLTLFSSVCQPDPSLTEKSTSSNVEFGKAAMEALETWMLK